MQAVFDGDELFGIILKWFGVSNMTEPVILRYVIARPT
jgi:hypothetical protein